MDYTYTSSGDGGAIGLVMWLCCCIIFLPLIAFWIWMLVDAIKRQYPAGKEGDKTLWIIIIVLVVF